MSLEICQYHGCIATSYQDELKKGSVFAVKNEQDLTEIAKNILISQKNHDHVKSRTDLKDRNIFLIYNVLPGGGSDYYIKNINLNNSEIQVKVVRVSCPGMGGPCDINAEFFILSAPKTYEKENFMVSFENLDIFSEPEFEGYEELLAIDKNIKKAFSTLDKSTKAKIFYIKSFESMSEESWFKSLNDNQKEIVSQYIEALISKNKKFEALGDKKYEKMRENERDCIQRYRELCKRLATPVIN